MPQLTSIGEGILCSCTSLTSVDLRGMMQLTCIGDYFLSWCSSLTSVDLSGMPQLTSIGDSFLRWCISVTSVDFSGITQLTCIGDFFLCSSSLTSVDLRGLSQLTCPHPPQKSANGKAKLALAGGGGRAPKGESKPSRSCAFPSELKKAGKAANSVAALYKALE